MIKSKMKIFALVSTAVSASSYKRTEFPAPGIVNTQGGYWADGQYNPPDGQAPQVSFQTQQCCKDLRWYPYKTDPGLEIWLHYGGEHRQMPYFEGEKDGEKVYAWMNYMGPDDYWFGNVKTAHWIISKKLGEYGDSTTDNELISDFSGLGFEKTGFISRPKCIEQATQWQNTFVCGNPQWGTGNLGEKPEQYGVPTTDPGNTRTCESANGLNQEGNKIFHGAYGEGKINTCHFSQLMEQLGKPQMKRAVYFIEPKKANVAEKLISDIIEEWKDLAGEGWKKLDCGWNALQGFTKRLTKRHYRDPVRCMTPNQPEKCKKGGGFIDRCESMCPMMKDISSFGYDTMEENSAYVAEETLNLVLWLADTYFTGYHLEESDDELKTIRGCRQDPNGWKMINNDGNPCEQTDKCGQHVRTLYKKVAEFETFLGEGSIGRLSMKYKQDWREDKLWREDQ